MNHLNSVLLEGVLTDDPRKVELVEAPTETRLVKFDLASDRYYMGRNGEKKVETVFVPVQCWGTLGDKALDRMRKGMTSRVVGRLRLCRWMGSDGTARRGMEIVAEHVEFRTPKASGRLNPALEVIEGENGESDSAGEPEVLYRI